MREILELAGAMLLVCAAFLVNTAAGCAVLGLFLVAVANFFVPPKAVSAAKRRQRVAR